MSFVGIPKFIVAETQCNRPAYPFPEERSLAHSAIIIQLVAIRSVEANIKKANDILKLMERVQEEMRWVVVVDELSREGKLQIRSTSPTGLAGN